MRCLIACEFSGTVRDAFIRRGHDAMSCDLLPTEALGPHYKGDVFDLDLSKFDLMIAHPPCTYLAVSGMHWTSRGLRDPQLTEDALVFVQRLLDAPVPKIALENPVSVISSRIRKPDQIVQPWWFGDDASKKTCLWLKDLPLLRKTKVIPPKGFRECPKPNQLKEFHYKTIDGIHFMAMRKMKPLWANQTPTGQNNLGPFADRWKERSKTYQGIADVMAEQWG